MSRAKTPLLWAFLGLSLCVPRAAHAQSSADESIEVRLAALPGPTAESRDAVRDILYAQPFTLEDTFDFAWSAERIQVEEGYILVLAVDPEIAQPRATGSAVLYVGARPAEVVGAGENGHVLTIVPGPIDLGSALIFFGSTALPERVDKARGQAELDAARAMGLAAFTPVQIEAALSRGGSAILAEGENGLFRSLAPIAREYLPNESALIERLELIPGSN